MEAFEFWVQNGDLGFTVKFSLKVLAQFADMVKRLIKILAS